MKILITGGTGFIGRALKKNLDLAGHDLFILTRAKRESTENTKYITWHWKNPADITYLMNEADIVVNLAGESISDNKWTKKQKEILRKSRTETTRLIVEAINNSSKKPKKLISASAVGIYGNKGDEIITEGSSLGNDFLANLCRDWEAEASKANTNVVILRKGIVIGASGGALKKFLPPFKMFLGGSLGSGNQWMPWIHIDDVVGLIKFAIENDKVTGVLNATSPKPVTNKEFSNILGKVLYRPSFMPIPGFALRIAFGEMADMLLSGQRAIPERALGLGYNFKYKELEETLKNTVG